MEELIGKRIVKFEVRHEEETGNLSFHTDEALMFVTDEGEEYKYLLYAECCSRSWVESIENAENLQDATVLKVNHRIVSGTEYESHTPSAGYLQIYNTEIITDKGSCVIEYRNDSNGAYGALLSLERDGAVIVEDFKTH